MDRGLTTPALGDHDPAALLTETTPFAPPPPARPRWLVHPATTHHVLPSGRLWIHPRGPADAARLELMCRFAARPNPRRGFLFVSTVLGRYLPVEPARFDATVDALHDALGRSLGSPVAGPVAFVGVAEAGVALAHALRARHVDVTGRDDTVLVTSTRHRFEAPLLYAFDEPHSHAPRHRLYAPGDPRALDRLRAAATVVVVDDEVTTGRTFAAFVAAHHARFPGVRRYVHAVLTSWLDHPIADAVAAPPGVDVALAALAHARYHFEPRPDYAPGLPDAVGVARAHPAPIGRFGRCTPLALSPDAPLPSVALTTRLLVLGSGEAQYPALLVARRYAADRAAAPAAARADGAAPVYYQASTRAPLRPGGVIRSVIAFPDDHDEGIDHYLYNVGADDYDAVLVCHAERPPAAALIDALTEHVPRVERLDVRSRLSG